MSSYRILSMNFVIHSKANSNHIVLTWHHFWLFNMLENKMKNSNNSVFIV